MCTIIMNTCMFLSGSLVFVHSDVDAVSHTTPKRTRNEDDSELQQLNDIRSLEKKYALLLTKTRESLKEKNVSPSALASHLSGYRFSVHPVMKDEKKLFADCQEDLRSASSIDAIFMSVAPFWSFLDYDVLEDIIEIFGTANDRQNLALYITNLKEFLDSWKVEPHKVSQYDFDRSADSQIKLCFKLDTESLSSYRHVKAAVARVLKVQLHTIQLCSIGEGCIELVFFCPSVIDYELLHSLACNEELSAINFPVLKITMVAGIFRKV